jgi:hypothetical protein
MASAVSPTTLASAKDAEPKSTKEFAELIKYLQNAHRDLMKWRAHVARCPPNHPPRIGNIVMKRSDLNRYSQVFLTQLGDLKKVYGNRKKRSTRTSTQLNSLFYVSDQLVDFYKDAKLGPSNPDQPRKGKLSNEISLLVDHRMATSGILTSLISRYIDANDLKSADNAGRFMPDKHMKDCLATTHYMLDGENFSKRKCQPGTSSEKEEKIREHIAQGKKSAFQKVDDRVDKRSGEAVYDKKKGLLYTTMMVFNNFYRVPTALLTEEEKQALSDPERIEEAKELQSKLTSITSWHNSNK